MPRSRASGCTIWNAWAAPARLRPAEPASTEPALRRVGHSPMLPASPSVRRGAPDAPARAPERTTSRHQPSRLGTVAASVRYEVDGWGIGELWFDHEVLLWHELPRPRRDAGVNRHHPLAERIRAYFAGSRDSFDDVELDLDGFTPFQQAVVETLRQVPWGEVVTYGELAALSGHPNAQRAAGSVCARNRFPLLVPCHRVVAADGIGRYGSIGIECKRRLLRLEGVTL
jgi:methylated-DNA-[protein]-cysteine S-methyltransferase